MKAYLATAVAAVLLCVWVVSAPEDYHVPAGPRAIGTVPSELLAADKGDAIAALGVTVNAPVPGHDEIFPLPNSNDVLVSGRDEWIWKVNTQTGDAEKIALSPVSPTGARAVPGKPDQVYFCMARLDFHHYEHGPGLYVLDLTTKQFTPVVTQVPITGIMKPSGLEQPNQKTVGAEIVYPTPLENQSLSALNDVNSRPLQFCNDLDVSPNGRYVYITEPFSHPKASSGLGAFAEGITLARNGRVWRYDTVENSVGLVVENIVFADGILVESDDAGEVTALIISETVNFRIGRAHLRGKRAGEYDVLWDNLPGLPDGLDRDADGRVWTALIKDRTPLISWMHENPWIKPLVLRIPPQWLPKSKGTAIVGFNADLSNIVAYSHHDGSRLLDISVVSPGQDKLFLPSFHKDNVGLHYLPLHALLSPTLTATEK